MVGLGRWARRLAALALALVAVCASVLSPVAAYGASTNGSAPPGQEARDRLEAEFSAVLSLREASGSMCLSVILDDELVFESRSGASLVPASLVKLATAAAALEVIRPDEVFSTEVIARTDAMESITDGVLVGDVYLIGQGDPVLSTPRYVSRYRDPVAHTDITGLADRVFSALAARGITRIEGRLVGDGVLVPPQGTRLLPGGADRRLRPRVETLLRDLEQCRAAVRAASQQRLLVLLLGAVERGPTQECASGEPCTARSFGIRRPP